MSGHRVAAGSIHTCERCGCKLRIPSGVGGVVMLCPECGEKFYTVFQLGPVLRRSDESGDAPRRKIRMVI